MERHERLRRTVAPYHETGRNIRPSVEFELVVVVENGARGAGEECDERRGDPVPLASVDVHTPTVPVVRFGHP